MDSDAIEHNYLIERLATRIDAGQGCRHGPTVGCYFVVAAAHYAAVLPVDHADRLSIERPGRDESRGRRMRMFLPVGMDDLRAGFILARGLDANVPDAHIRPFDLNPHRCLLKLMVLVTARLVDVGLPVAIERMCL